MVKQFFIFAFSRVDICDLKANCYRISITDQTADQTGKSCLYLDLFPVFCADYSNGLSFFYLITDLYSAVKLSFCR